jgi:hypothetical protein
MSGRTLFPMLALIGVVLGFGVSRGSVPGGNCAAMSSWSPPRRYCLLPARPRAISPYTALSMIALSSPSVSSIEFPFMLLDFIAGATISGISAFVIP